MSRSDTYEYSLPIHSLTEWISDYGSSYRDQYLDTASRHFGAEPSIRMNSDTSSYHTFLRTSGRLERLQQSLSALSDSSARLREILIRAATKSRSKTKTDWLLQVRIYPKTDEVFLLQYKSREALIMASSHNPSDWLLLLAKNHTSQLDGHTLDIIYHKKNLKAFRRLFAHEYKAVLALALKELENEP